MDGFVCLIFKPTNTLRQILVQPKDRMPKQKKSNLVYAVQSSEERVDLYIAETKQPLHRRANASGQDSEIFLHLKNKGYSFEDLVCRYILENTQI